jgi:hypothetical protein
MPGLDPGIHATGSARRLPRIAGSGPAMTPGIVHDSVRRAGGVNVCLFRPTLEPLPALLCDRYEYRRDATGAPRTETIANVDPA